MNNLKLQFFLWITKFIFTIKRYYQSFLKWVGINFPIFILKLFCTNEIDKMKVLGFLRVNKNTTSDYIYSSSDNILRLCWFFKYCNPLLSTLHWYCNRLTPCVKTDYIEIIYWTNNTQIIKYRLKFNDRQYDQHIFCLLSNKKHNIQNARIKFNQIDLSVPTI